VLADGIDGNDADGITHRLAWCAMLSSHAALWLKCIDTVVALITHAADASCSTPRLACLAPLLHLLIAQWRETAQSNATCGDGVYLPLPASTLQRLRAFVGNSATGRVVGEDSLARLKAIL
jgi:hypothetical protein